jgi:hypothetical protein
VIEEWMHATRGRNQKKSTFIQPTEPKKHRGKKTGKKDKKIAHFL